MSSIKAIDGHVNRGPFFVIEFSLKCGQHVLTVCKNGTELIESGRDLLGNDLNENSEELYHNDARKG